MNLFKDAPVIYSYSRKQAIEDGVLIDITDVAKEAGFRFPVAITASVYALAVPPKNSHEDEDGRIWDMVWMLHCATKNMIPSRKPSPDLTFYRLKIGRSYVELKAQCGPGDDEEPVITIMLPSED